MFNTITFKCFLGISILIVLGVNNLYSQKDIEYAFLNEFDTPVSDVLIYNHGQLISITDNNGICRVKESVDTVLCHRLGCIDTLVSLKKCIDNKILFNCFYMTDNVMVKGKYKSKKHLKKLQNISQEIFDGMDTLIYYKYIIDIEVLNTNQREVFEGVITVPYNNRHGLMYHQEANYCTIKKYENNIPETIYKQLPFNLIRMVLNGNILLNNSAWKRTLKRKIKNQYSLNDSVVFRCFKNEDIDGYIGFKNNRLDYVEYIYKSEPLNKHKEFADLFNIYYKMTYFNHDNVIYPVSANTVRTYLVDNDKIINYRLKLDAIEKCACDFDEIDSKVYMFLRNNQEKP